MVRDRRFDDFTEDPADGGDLGPVRCPTLPEGVGVRRADVFRAVDRPDRLELEVVEAKPTGEPGGPRLESSEAFRPGRSIELWTGSHRIFDGAVERSSARSDREGLSWTAVAYAGYEPRRRLAREETYRHVTDADVVWRVAAALGLRARVQPTREVNERLVRRGDPLRFLRGLARRNGFDLVISGGELFFGEELPDLGRPPIAVDLWDGHIAVEVEDRGDAGRGGRLEVAGGFEWEPLLALDLRGLGSRWDARYRAARVLHFLGAAGLETRVEFLELGLDYEGWKEASFEEGALGDEGDFHA